MNNPKVHTLLENLERDFSQVLSTVETLVKSILQWADELLETSEKGFSASRESPVFLLPKTPSEKKAHNRKARNALVSKCSVINSTVSNSDVSVCNDSLSTRARTRAAHRAASSKMSQSIITEEKETIPLDVERQIIKVEKDENEKFSKETFVIPQTTFLCEKPGVENKDEITVPETSNPITRASRRRAARTLTKGLKEVAETAKKMSRIQNENPVETKSPENTATTASPELLPARSKISKIKEVPANDERASRRKASRTLSASPQERRSRRKMSRTLSRSPPERQGRLKVSRTLSGSPVVRSSHVLVPGTPMARSTSTGASGRGRAPPLPPDPNTTFLVNEKKKSDANRTVTIKTEAAPTFIISHEEEVATNSPGAGSRRTRPTSTPLAGGDGDRAPGSRESSPDFISDDNAGAENATKTNATFSVDGGRQKGEAAGVGNPVPKKKKRKARKEEEEEVLKENIEEVVDTVRITRTKSKAIKQMMEESETKSADLSAVAKKILNRAKMTSLKKNQLAALLENASSTPKNGPITDPLGGLVSKSKYHLLLSSSNKAKTPLATLPNSAVIIPKKSEYKSRGKMKVGRRDNSLENLLRSASKLQKDELLEKEMKLKSKKEKEEGAAMKRQIVIKSKQEELKRKNELKHQMAMKQREKLEQEKYNNMIQSEKEKEERHKLILQERQMKLKEEAFKKKMLTQQKIAETNERRRLEEEARIAKLKEMEAEEQRLALEKQREQERQEKRAQERLAQKKAREEYEMQLRQEMEAERLRSEKLEAAKKHLQSATKGHSASKRPKFGLTGEKREWDYKPRNEDDYGLDGEDSEVDSGDDKYYDNRRAPVAWAERILKGKCELVKTLTLEMMCEYMPCYQKSPDIHKMFKMTPSKRIKRTSSAIWNTSSS